MGSHDNDAQVLPEVATCFDFIEKVVIDESNDSAYDDIQKQLEQAVKLTLSAQQRDIAGAKIAVNLQKIRNYYYMYPDQIRCLIVKATCNYRVQHFSTLSQRRVEVCSRLEKSKSTDGCLLLLEIMRARDEEMQNHATSGTVRHFVHRKFPWPRCSFVVAMNKLLEHMLIDEAAERFLLGVEPMLKVVYGVLVQFEQDGQPLLRDLQAVLAKSSIDDMHAALTALYKSHGAIDVTSRVGISLDRAIKAYADDNGVVLGKLPEPGGVSLS